MNGMNIFIQCLVTVFIFSLQLSDAFLFSASADFLKIGLLATILSFSYFLFHNKKLSIETKIDTFVLLFSSVLLLSYTYSQGLVHLPESVIPNQKFYLRFFFYATLFFVILLQKKNSNMVFWLTLVSASQLYLTWGTLLSGSQFSSLLFYVLCFTPTRKIKLTRGLTLLGLFAFLSILVIPFGSSMKNSLQGVLFYSALFIITFRMYLSRTHETRRLLTFHSIFAFSSSLLFLFFLFVQGGIANNNTSVGSFQVNSIGSYLTLLFPFTIFLLFFSKNRKSRINSLVFLSVFSLLLFLTQTRSAIFTSLLLCLAFLIRYFQFNRLPRKLKIASFFVLPVIIASFFLFSPNKNMLGDFKSFEIRQSIWKEYILNTYNDSFLFGSGYQSQFIHLSKKIIKAEEALDLLHFERTNSKVNPHSHNIFVQTFNDYGFIGLILFTFGFLFSLTSLSFKGNSKKNWLRFSLNISILGFLFQEFFDFVFLDPNVLLTVSIFLGLSNRFRKKETETLIVSANKLRFVQLAILFGFIFPAWILHQNAKFRILLQESFFVDNFTEVTYMKSPSMQNQNQVERIRNLSFNLFLDDTAALYYALSQIVIYKETQDQERLVLADQVLSSCTDLNPFAIKCFYLLNYTCLELNNSYPKRECDSFRKKADEMNNYHLISPDFKIEKRN